MRPAFQIPYPIHDQNLRFSYSSYDQIKDSIPSRYRLFRKARSVVSVILESEYPLPPWHLLSMIVRIDGDKNVSSSCCDVSRFPVSFNLLYTRTLILNYMICRIKIMEYVWLHLLRVPFRC